MKSKTLVPIKKGNEMFCTKEGAGSVWQNIQGPQTLQELPNCPNWAKKGMIERKVWLVYGGQIRLGSFSAFYHPGVDFNSYLTACIFSGGSVHPFPLVLL